MAVLSPDQQLLERILGGRDPDLLLRVLRKLDRSLTAATGTNSEQARQVPVPPAGINGQAVQLLRANPRRKSCLLVSPSNAAGLFLGIQRNFGTVSAIGAAPPYGIAWASGEYLGTDPNEYNGEFWAYNSSAAGTAVLSVSVLEFVTGDPLREVW